MSEERKARSRSRSASASPERSRESRSRSASPKKDRYHSPEDGDQGKVDAEDNED